MESNEVGHVGGQLLNYSVVEALHVLQSTIMTSFSAVSSCTGLPLQRRDLPGVHGRSIAVAAANPTNYLETRSMHIVENMHPMCKVNIAFAKC